MAGLKTSQYGKCVYKCDNNVVDHQTVNMVFDGDITVTMTMCAFTQGGRKTHIMATNGELFCDMSNKTFEFYDFATREKRKLTAEIAISGDSILSGHGGGDQGTINALYEYITGKLSAEDVSEIGISCKNHMLVFAAEESRLTDRVVHLDEYSEKYM